MLAASKTSHWLVIPSLVMVSWFMTLVDQKLVPPDVQSVAHTLATYCIKALSFTYTCEVGTWGWGSLWGGSAS